MSSFTIDVNINASKLSEAITAFAKALTAIQDPKAISNTAVTAPPTETAKPEQELEPEAKPEQKAEPVVSLETVRAKLAALSQDGKQAQVKSLITKFGAKKLTEIPAEKYPELLEAARSI